MSSVLVNCESCKKELERRPYQIKASKTGLFFCNRECKSKWHTSVYDSRKVEKNCPICNSTIRASKGKLKNRTYCSKSCLAKFKSIRAKITVNCVNCNVEFVKDRHQLRSNNCCNVKCRSEWNSKLSKRIKIKCVTCDVEFEIYNHDKNRLKNCSKECFRKYLSFKSKSDEDYINRLRNNGLKSAMNMKKYDTLPERLVEEYLIDNDIRFEKQKKICDKYLVDFYLPGINTILEVNGDYWHGNPRVYGEGLKPLSKYHVEKRIKDSIRKNELRSLGYKFEVLWEMDIHSDLEKYIKPIINQNP